MKSSPEAKASAQIVERSRFTQNDDDDDEKQLLASGLANVIAASYLSSAVPSFSSSSTTSMGAFVPSSDVQQQRSTLASIAVSSTRTDSAISQTSAIDISKWKSEVTKVLPPGCIVAKMILKEPDILERSEAEVKIPMYLRMIKEELDKLELDSHL
jgi:hypothetical protein